MRTGSNTELFFEPTSDMILKNRDSQARILIHEAHSAACKSSGTLA